MFMSSINILASLAIIAHCGCRLSVQQWKMKQPELWIHALLLAASIGVGDGEFPERGEVLVF